ncbi:MAG: cyclase family protein [Promethearchaeota archaeon]
MVKFYDISLLINEDIILYPGSPKISITPHATIPKDTVNESLITFGSHTGTHIDSPLHISKNGKDTSQIDIKSFYGQCKVLDLTQLNLEIQKKDLEVFNLKAVEIVLLKTQNSIRGYKEFREDYVHVKLDAAQYLIDCGIKTLGVDHLSVKKFGGDDEVHELLINNLTLFEGLNLSDVPAGSYLFVGLPLRIACDGAPARAILVKS